ncbi:MAG: ABC transporter permease subunit [Chloroflexi bacterium]|nr:ABC transporter permease subunit [Chloroflexota bacterium]
MPDATANPRIAKVQRVPATSLAGMVKSRKGRRLIRLAIVGVIALVALLYTVFPVYWVLVAALDPLGNLATQQLLPQRVGLDNFRLLLQDPAYPFATWMANSLKISFITGAISVCLTTISAYAFSRFRFRGRRTLMKGIVLVQVFPNMLALVSLYLIIQQIGMFIPIFGLDTHGSLILVYLGGILGGNVWLMKGYIDTIPKELDESAMIDGASHWQIFWWLIFPLIRPMLAVILVLVFIGAYGDIIVARVLLKANEQLTVGVGLWQFVSAWQTPQRWGPFTAGALLAALPALVLFYALQDWLVTGLTAGSVK